MDRRDVEILKTIAKHGTGKPEKISDETGIPKSTIYYRLNNLREKGIITNDLYDVDLEELGLTHTIIVEVIASYDEQYHELVGEKISEIDGVSQVFFTMGQRDFVVIGHVPNREEVERLIADFEAIDEVHRTESKFVISSLKNEQRPLSSYSTERLLEHLATADPTE